MAIQTHSVTLKLHSDGWKSLGVSNLTANPVTCVQNLVEGVDFEVHRVRGGICRLKSFDRTLYSFTCQYDDLSETMAVEKGERTADRNAAQQAVENLQAYQDLSSPTGAQTVAVVKLLCRVAVVLIRRVLG
jgi:hypothetical protein